MSWCKHTWSYEGVSHISLITELLSPLSEFVYHHYFIMFPCTPEICYYWGNIKHFKVFTCHWSVYLYYVCYVVTKVLWLLICITHITNQNDLLLVILLLKSVGSICCRTAGLLSRPWRPIHTCVARLQPHKYGKVKVTTLFVCFMSVCP